MTAENYIDLAQTALNANDPQKAQVLATLAVARATMTVGNQLAQAISARK